METKQWQRLCRQRRQRSIMMVNFYILALTLGVTLTAYYPTEYFYIKNVFKVTRADLYCGFAKALLYISSMLAILLTCFYIDKTKKIRRVFLLTDVLCIVGNILYLLHYNIALFLISQCFLGFGNARAVIAYQEINRVFNKGDATKKLSISFAFLSGGLILGPITVYIFQYVDFHIGSLHICVGNCVALFMLLLHVIQLVLNLLTLQNFFYIYNDGDKKINPLPPLEVFNAAKFVMDHFGEKRMYSTKKEKGGKSTKIFTIVESKNEEENKENNGDEFVEVLGNKHAISDQHEDWEVISVHSLKSQASEAKVQVENKNKEIEQPVYLQPEVIKNYLQNYFTTLVRLFQNNHVIYIYLISFFTALLRSHVTLIQPIKMQVYFKWNETDISTLTIVQQIFSSIPTVLLLHVFRKHIDKAYAHILSFLTLILSLLCIGCLQYVDDNETAATSLVYITGLSATTSGCTSHIIVTRMLMKAIPLEIQAISQDIYITFVLLGYVLGGLFVVLPVNYLFETMVTYSGIVFLSFIFYLWELNTFQNLKLEYFS